MQAPVVQCVNVSSYERLRGCRFVSLPAGNYSMEVQAVTLANNGPWTGPVFMPIPSPPGFPRHLLILLSVLVPLGAVALGALLVFFVYKRKLKKYSNPDYVLNILSTNPDYISVGDVYKPDQWELKR